MKKILLVFAMLVFQLDFSQSKTDSNQKITTQAPELNQEKRALYNEAFFKFINALKASDRKAMEELLSEKAKKVVTDRVYTRLSEDIDFSKKLEIFRSGYKSLKDGSSYPMIEYKYTDDAGSPPKEIITAIFENDGKILGIKPVKNNPVSK